MTTTATRTLADRIEAALQARDHEAMAQLYRPDVLFDGNVPEWRFQLLGPKAVLEMAEAEEADAGDIRVTALRATPTADGLVAEVEVHFTHGGQEHLCRELHLLHTDGTAISEHVLYCTGIWDADTIARQAAEAPMIRR